MGRRLTIEYAAAKQSDVREVRPFVSFADQDEAAAMGFSCISEALSKSIETSQHTVTARTDRGSILGIGGYSVDAGMVVPWALLTDLARVHRVALVKETRAILASIRKAHPNLPCVNQVASSNQRAIDFIEILGFTLGPEEAHRKTAKSVRTFWMDPLSMEGAACAS